MATMSYIDKKHEVKLPEDIVKHLGLENGGGVVFLINKDGQVVIVTNDDFVKLLIPDDSET